MKNLLQTLGPIRLQAFKKELATVEVIDSVVPALRDSTYGLVDELRAKGKRVEDVIILLRYLCLNVGLQSMVYRSGEWNSRTGRDLVDKIITLSIIRYYSDVAVVRQPDGQG